MQRSTLPLALALAACLLAAGAPRARAQAKAQKPDRVKFETVDGVELAGTFWPSTKGRKAPCALLLHRLGGKSHDDGWDALAEKLQERGFAVLSFDFRGHGGSTTVDPMTFWAAQNTHNTAPGLIRRRGGARPTTIAFADFSARYVPFLVNDIAAARLFLDRKNDANDLNVSNLVLIGAEEGATLGALFLAAESHRYRVLPGLKLAGKPESKDVAACVWLSMNRTLGRGHNVSTALTSWLKEAGREQKVPMAFIYGKNDKAGADSALALVKTIRPKYVRQGKSGDDDLTTTGDWGVPGSKLVGSKLLNKQLPTANWIIKDYLESKAFEDQGKLTNGWEKRESDKYPFAWTFGRGTVKAKDPDEKALGIIPLTPLGLR